MSIFIGSTPAQTAVGNIVHDAIVFGTPSARVVEHLAALGLINEDYTGPVDPTT